MAKSKSLVSVSIYQMSKIAFLFSVAKLWFPNLLQTVIYSEILDKHLSITCTRKTLALIDENHGFDNYILRTPEQDLKSQLALGLKRKMLIALAKQDYHEGNEVKKNYVNEKYKDFVVPVRSDCLLH